MFMISSISIELPAGKAINKIRKVKKLTRMPAPLIISLAKAGLWLTNGLILGSPSRGMVLVMKVVNPPKGRAPRVHLVSRQE